MTIEFPIPKFDESPLEREFLRHCIALGLPEPVRQYRFHPKRRWKADFAWPVHMVLVELEGGVYRRGWHQSIARYISDCRKYRAAAIMGYRVLRYVGEEVRDGSAVREVELVLKGGTTAAHMEGR